MRFILPKFTIPHPVTIKGKVTEWIFAYVVNDCAGKYLFAANWHIHILTNELREPSTFMEIYLLIKSNLLSDAVIKLMEAIADWSTSGERPKVRQVHRSALGCVPTSPPYPRHTKQPEGERSAHRSSLESRNDSKFFSLPLPRSSMRWEILL